MTQKPSRDVLLLSARRVWWRVLMMMLIFVCGGVVGAAAGAWLMRNHVIDSMKHPEQLADRIMPRIRARLDLTDEQSRKVEAIVLRRHAAMESIRATSHPLQVAEFQAMRKEVAEALAPEQRSRWEELCDSIEQRFLPAQPGPPPADRLFEPFDANGDGALTEDEVPPPVWRRLRRADLNGDGKVTREEYEKARSLPGKDGTGGRSP